MKRWIAAGLALSMCASMCACGSAAKKLTGTWRLTLDFTAEDMDLDTPDGFDEEMSMYFLFTFNGEGIYTIALDTEASQESMNQFVQAYMDVVLNQMAEEEGLTRDEVDTLLDATFQEEAGMTFEEYMEDELAVENFWTDDEMNYTGPYTVEGNKLLLDPYSMEETPDDDYVTFEVSGTTLTLTEADGADGSALGDFLEFPVTLEKVE